VFRKEIPEKHSHSLQLKPQIPDGSGKETTPAKTRVPACQNPGFWPDFASIQ
jgi:hypothetical protein